MNTETQKLQEEINSMGLVELLNTEVKLKQNFSDEDCPALRVLIRNKITDLNKMAFTILSQNHDSAQ